MIRVLVIDDSLTVRRLLSRQLAADSDIEVVGTADSAYSAREQIVRHRPDVITLDLEMPRMGGLSFLERLMQHFPLPVVVVSSFSNEHSINTQQALRLGARAVIEKPKSPADATSFALRLSDAIRAASTAQEPRPFAPPTVTAVSGYPGRVILLGASTGGLRAIEHILQQLPVDSPPVLIAQHLPSAFMESFVRRLDASCALRVRLARDGEVPEPGTALVAPGADHMLLERHGDAIRIRLLPGMGQVHQCSSVDPLFASAARAVGQHAVAVLLTGMGGDGAEGLLRLRETGALTVAESEDTTVVFGMPRVAIEIGAAAVVSPLHDIPAVITDWITAAANRRSA